MQPQYWLLGLMLKESIQVTVSSYSLEAPGVLLSLETICQAA